MASPNNKLNHTGRHEGYVWVIVESGLRAAAGGSNACPTDVTSICEPPIVNASVSVKKSHPLKVFLQ